MKKLLGLILTAIFVLSSTSYAVDDWTKASPAGSNQAADIDTLQQANNTALDRVLANYRENCAIYYISTSSIGIKAGEVVCSNSGGTLRKFRKNPSATTLTWANIDVGSEANSTTYYVYAVADADAATFTGLISTNSTTPTGATYYKKLGEFYNNSSGNILNDDTIINYNNYYALRYGDWESKSTDTTYQASTDGIVTAYTTSGSFIIYTDGSSPPTTARDQGGAAASYNAGASVPVKKNDYYKVTLGSGSASVYWLPLEREV